MKRRTDPDLTPLPKWKQHRAKMVAWWRRSRDRRQRTLKNLRNTGRKVLTLAISLLGVILVSYGAWTIYAPGGFIAAGGLLWVLQWNYGDERGDG